MEAVQNGVYDVHSILHWVSKDDPRGPYPTNPASDPQYRLWEYGVQNWAANSGYSGYSSVPSNGTANSTATSTSPEPIPLPPDQTQPIPVNDQQNNQPLPLP